MAAVAQISARQLLLLDLNLEKVNNWAASAAVNLASDTTYATAGAVKKAYDLAALALPATANAVSATKLATARTFSLTGDATATASFDGTANATLAVTLASTGVTPGTYGGKITVDAKGRVTAAAALVAADIPNLNWSKITSGKPTTLAGYGITDALGVNGNAVSATKLATARTLTVGNTGKAFDGSANVAWSLAEIGAYSAAGGGIMGDFWRASGTNQFGLVDSLGTINGAKPGLVLLAKKYVGTLMNKTGFVGRVFFNRGGSGSGNTSDFVDLSVTVAYNSNQVRLLARSPSGVVMKIVEVTYNAEVYYALYRPSSSSCEVVVTGHAFDVVLPLLIADATAYTITDVVTDEENYHAGNKPTAADVGLGSVDNAKQMRAEYLNGYWGMVAASGDPTVYVRAPQAGIIPYQSGGSGYLGTSSWPFLYVYANAIFEGGAALSAKYLGLGGGTLSGDLNFANSGTASRGIQGVVGSNDYWFFGGGATASDAGYVEIASGDNGNEPIYVRQYAGAPLATATPVRTATLLDASGNTLFPGVVTASSFTGNASSASKWATARTITVNGDATGSVSLDGSANVTLTINVTDNGHTHTSSTITDLNAQSSAATANTLALRDASADITTRLFRSNYADQTTLSGAMAFRINNSTDNYIRFCSDEAAIRTWLGALGDGGTYGTLTFNNWVRTTGNTGWYNATHGGGVYMTDTTYVRVSHNKAFYVNNTASGSISTDGGVYATGNGSFADVTIRSDRALKSNFEALEDGLGKVLQLTGQIYDKRLMGMDGEVGVKREAGLIAQDLEAVLPLGVHRDDDGYLSISQTGLNALLVEAVKGVYDKFSGQIQQLSEQIQMLRGAYPMEAAQ